MAFITSVHYGKRAGNRKALVSGKLRMATTYAPTTEGRLYVNTALDSGAEGNEFCLQLSYAEMIELRDFIGLSIDRHIANHIGQRSVKS